MANNKLYVAVGEEATRGTAESSTVGFVPVQNGAIPKLEPDDIPRNEFRGEETPLGDTLVRRLGLKWSHSMEMPFFTEGGTVSGIVGTLLKHFFGKGTSAQNGSTGQYYHMLYPVPDPYATTSGHLSTKAITLNYNYSEGGTVKNHAYRGGRITAVTFTQEVGQPLIVTFDFVGQDKVAAGTLISSPTFAAENLRADFNNLTVYNGTITRTGTGPDFTQFAFGSATTVTPDKISVKIENGLADKMQIAGVLYPTKSNLGMFKYTIDMDFDFEDPASGFSSVDDYNLWLASSSTTNWFCHWDTGTQAGTGDNHGLYLDLPTAQRGGGDPTFDREKDPTISLTYTGLYNSTTAYEVGAMLKNTASGI
jgi:hypothetical protein